MNPDTEPLSSADPITTVVVDDSPAVLTAVRWILPAVPRAQLIGTAADGQEAVEVVAQLRPRLVLLDFQMPRMNGLFAAQAIRRDFPETRIIIMSAHGGPDLEERSRSHGADAFVEKRHLPDVLPALVAEWFG
jgi:two-component system NarL family response regulator